MTALTLVFKVSGLHKRIAANVLTIGQVECLLMVLTECLPDVSFPYFETQYEYSGTIPVFTITPMSTFAQNNGVIALTRCANRKAGYACCFWLIVMGIFSKFAAALVAIPSSVLGGMTTFLFSAVAVSGIRIISTMVCLLAFVICLY